MTGETPAGFEATGSGTRSARLRSEFADAETAARVAAALSPDNTASIETQADGRTVVTRIDRETTGGLQSTLDDYVVNLQVAAQLTTTDGDSSTKPDNHE